MATCPTSTLTFDNLDLRLVVSRAAGCAMLTHLVVGVSLGVFIRRDTGLYWIARAGLAVDLGNPPSEVWATITTMI